MPSEEIHADEQDPNEGTDAAEVEHCMPPEFVCEELGKGLVFPQYLIGRKLVDGQRLKGRQMKRR